MPLAVRLVSTDREWLEFEEWLRKPKPIMLDRSGRFPDVPHELADELFSRLINKLKDGDLIAFGRWGKQPELTEIDPKHWFGMWYNIWFNELGYGDEGQAGFTSIVVEERRFEKPAPSKNDVRKVVKRLLAEWIEANPGTKITKAEMLGLVRERLGAKYKVSQFLFDNLWQSDFPRAHKFSNRPPQ